jgi:hypothetical protein
MSVVLGLAAIQSHSTGVQQQRQEIGADVASLPGLKVYTWVFGPGKGWDQVMVLMFQKRYALHCYWALSWCIQQCWMSMLDSAEVVIWVAIRLACTRWVCMIDEDLLRGFFVDWLW